MEYCELYFEKQRVIVSSKSLGLFLRQHLPKLACQCFATTTSLCYNWLVLVVSLQLIVEVDCSIPMKLAIHKQLKTHSEKDFFHL